MNYLEKIYLALNTSLENAEDLFVDAGVLEKNRRFPRAYTLYHFSFEETGRFFILLGVIIDYAKDKLKIKDINPKLLKARGYEIHLKKLSKSNSEFKKYASYMMILGADDNLFKSLTSFVQSLDENKMDKNKNGSIYLCLSGNEFETPSKALNEDDFEEMKFLAEMNLNFAKRIVSTLGKEGALKSLVAKLKQVN